MDAPTQHTERERLGTMIQTNNNDRTNMNYSVIGILAARIEGYSTFDIAEAYDISEFDVSRHASASLHDVLREFGLVTQFRIRFGGVNASYSEFADWIEKTRGVSWVSVLTEREAIEVVEVLQYVQALTRYNASSLTSTLSQKESHHVEKNNHHPS